MHKMSTADKAICIMGFAGFAVLTVLVLTHIIDPLNQKVLADVTAARPDWLTKIAVPFSYSGNWQVCVVVGVILLIIPATRWSYGIPMFASGVLSVVVYQVIKNIIRNPRPDVSYHLLTQDGYSFPSGHSQSTLLIWGTFLMLLFYYFRRKGDSLPIYKKPHPTKLYPKDDRVLMVIGAIVVCYIWFMGLSRIYVSVHWTSDVLAGWCLGFGFLPLLHWLFIEDRVDRSLQ